MKISSILGLNARSALFSYTYNSARGKAIALSKIWTKRVLDKNGIAVPEIYKIFSDPHDIFDFAWDNLPNSFALKPNKGLGGEGIIIAKKRISHAWLTTTRKKVSVDDLKLHVLDILEGAYSVGSVSDKAYIEEYVGRHKSLRKYAYRGTPDIRVIVFNSVPIMAMLRLPTSESQGRANLHQGAIGVGVDIATGITMHASWHGKPAIFKPGTSRKLHGIKIPFWNRVLETAISCQRVTGLGYVGVDVVLHPSEGPMVLELNSEPGLEIQLANRAGLRKRLEMVEDITIVDSSHAVDIAKALFSTPLSVKAKVDYEKTKRLSVFEDIKIQQAKGGKRMIINAKVDTGAWRTSIDENLASSLGLLHKDNILWTKRVRSSLGVRERPVIRLSFYLKGKKIDTLAGVTNREHMRRRVIIGRRDLNGFLIETKNI